MSQFLQKPGYFANIKQINQLHFDFRLYHLSLNSLPVHLKQLEKIIRGFKIGVILRVQVKDHHLNKEYVNQHHWVVSIVN